MTMRENSPFDLHMDVKEPINGGLWGLGICMFIA